MRRLILSLLTLMIVLSATAQRADIRQLFLSMPSSVLPSLNEERKEELLAQYDAHKEGRAYTLKEIPYSLTSTAATIHTITPDYLELKLDEVSSLQLKVLPKGWRGYMVSMVLTSEVVPRQSILLFYDQQWRRLPTDKYYTFPALAQFFTNPELLNHNDPKRVLSEVGALAYSYQWSPTEPLLTTKITSFDLPLYQKQYPQAGQWLRAEGVTHQWKRGQLRSH